MRINDFYGKLNDGSVQSTGQGAATGQPTQVGGSGGQSVGAKGGGETVTVSKEAQQLADKASSDAETAKVSQLRSAIADGTFRVDPQAIAARIVQGG